MGGPPTGQARGPAPTIAYLFSTLAMTVSLSDDRVRRLRLRAQLLTPRPADAPARVEQVVRDLCGAQAQEAQAALAVRARTAGLVGADVEHARGREGSVVRT